MRVLVVAPFPPLRDGIGKYAAQEVRKLRGSGATVEVLSPLPCAAHHVEDLNGGFKLMKVRRLAKRFDETLFNYQPSLFHKKEKGFGRLLTEISMWWLFRSTPNLKVICHEVEYPSTGKPSGVRGFLQRRAWQSADELIFHTGSEAEEMEHNLGVSPERVRIRPHGAHFERAISETKASSRARLGIAEEDWLFLCIGFIQPHKGFDRAIRAFQRVESSRSRLIVVGSVRTAHPEHDAYLDALSQMARGDPRVTFRDQALSDQEFDRWINASDVVVLPYREIFSSGVLERAKLFDRPVIMTDVGGLRDQAREDDKLVSDDEGLARAMAEAAGAPMKDPDLTVKEAQALVDEQAQVSRRRLTEITGDLARVLEEVETSIGIHSAVAPSARPVIGPAVTLLKRVLRKLMSWQTEPMIVRINEFESSSFETLVALAQKLDQLASDVARLTQELEQLERDPQEDRSRGHRSPDG